MSNTPINIIGWGLVAPTDLTTSATTCHESVQLNVRPYLRDPKMRKFMAKQDQLAVQAAAEAVRHAGLEEDCLTQRTGIYLTVGLLPFEQQPLDTLYQYSVDNGRFSMERFSNEAVNRLNPLLTFQCLPNMPLFHISYNLAIQGPYFITYPGGGQWFQALQQARMDLDAGLIDYALLGAVADQDNALVRYQIGRQLPEHMDGLIDSACVLVLTKSNHKQSYAQFGDLDIDYTPTDPLSPDVTSTSDSKRAGNIPVAKNLLKIHAGACDPSIYIALNLQHNKFDTLQLHYCSQDGIEARLKVHHAE